MNPTNPMNPTSIRNIIFDLGGVLLNLNYQLTEQAFINLGIPNFNELYSQFHADSFFKEFEKGNISPAQFIQELKIMRLTFLRRTLLMPGMPCCWIFQKAG